MFLATERYIKFKADCESSYLKVTLNYLEDFVIALEELKEKNYSNDKYKMICNLYKEISTPNISSNMKIIAFNILVKLHYHEYEFKEFLQHKLNYLNILPLDMLLEVYN